MIILLTNLKYENKKYIKNNWKINTLPLDLDIMYATFVVIETESCNIKKSIIYCMDIINIVKYEYLSITMYASINEIEIILTTPK